ncbi:alpha/beta fold hydrolase [Nocardiopsis sp. CC223A]|uniref:alpha/beta fold hydrolase n=1 Tax=Nocardiopsis sp. CC223A TaxID=3044051 RepID=UPI00278C8DAE|nr:alpha/beta hydrolase [Nocardiopsis sp. CC223A]
MATDPVRSGELLLPSGDALVCAEAFGSAQDPTVLLIGGAASSMDYWEDGFCARLAAAGRHVVRYDLRDTGRSTAYPAGAPGYTRTDLVADALAVLDGLGARTAHLVGISMGADLAQCIALGHPERVVSLTLESATPGGPDRPGLPPMEPRLKAVFADQGPGPDWTDRAAAIEAMVEGERVFAGSVFDAERSRATSARVYDRTTDMAAMQTNHWILEEDGSPDPDPANITVPTLVLHGTEDPLFPLPHGQALAGAIPGARLVPLPGVGHQYPPEPLWDPVLAEITAHTAR